MRFLWGWPGWGWHMYGILGKNNMWFIGLSRQSTVVTPKRFHEILDEAEKDAT